MNEEASVSVEHVVQQLRDRRSDALAALDLLRADRDEVVRETWCLESPEAVLAYVDFFARFVSQGAAECERAAAELLQGATAAPRAALRGLASRSEAEQRRCLVFRDKWINKPLPHERLRPLLNEISITTRDQLTAFRELAGVAASIDSLTESASPAEPSRRPERGFDRRALFTRLFKP